MWAFILATTNSFMRRVSGSVVRVENMQEGYWASRFNGAQRLDSEAAQQVMKSELIKTTPVSKQDFFLKLNKNLK